MPQALIFHEDKLQTLPLVKYLKRRRVEVFHAVTFEQIEQLIQGQNKFEPGLVIIPFKNSSSRIFSALATGI